MVVLLVFPIDREKAVRLGAAARWQDWPLHQGGVVASAPMEACSLAARAIEEMVPRGSLIDEARLENDRLKDRLAVNLIVDNKPLGVPSRRTPCASLDASMIVRGSGQRRASHEPFFHFDDVQLAVGPVIRAYDLKALVRRYWRGLVHWFHPLLHRGVSVASTLQAQPGLRHGNQFPDFPVARPDDCPAAEERL